MTGAIPVLATMRKIPRINYPKAVWLFDGGVNADGEGWGPLPDESRGASFDQIRIVFHTTESGNMPAYNGGGHAPHVTFWPAQGKVYQHNQFDRRVGTLLGSGTTGILGNEFSIQAEIICYSDRDLAEERGHLWVGDLTNEHYEMFATWVRWVEEELGVPVTSVYGPSVDFDTFLYGKHTVTRMSDSEWLNAGGVVTAHGAAARQDHWDTGVLDLHRIYALAKGEDPPPPPPELVPEPTSDGSGLDFVEYGHGIQPGGGWRKRVRYWQRILRRVGLYEGDLNGIYHDEMRDAVAQVPGVEDPNEIGNKNAFLIHRFWLRSESTDVATELITGMIPELVENLPLKAHVHTTGPTRTGFPEEV